MQGYARNSSGVEGGQARRLYALLLILPFVLTAYLLSSGDSGLVKLWDQASRIEILETDIDRLKKKNAELTEEVQLLTDDPKTIERLARERYGMVKDNESVYMVYPNPPVRKTP